MRKTKEQLEAMSRDEIKAEWDSAAAEFRKIQPLYNEILKKMEIKEGQKVNFTTKEELEISEKYRQAEEYMELVGKVRRSKM